MIKSTFYDDQINQSNLPTPTALFLRDIFTKNSTHIVPQPPYSSDLAPCDFWLFSKLKRPLRGYRFDSIEEIKAESKKVLKAIPEIDFNNCFEDWKKRWHNCNGEGLLWMRRNIFGKINKDFKSYKMILGFIWTQQVIAKFDAIYSDWANI